MSIPTELLTEILSLLPVKSLARFKCVSKQWHRLMSDSLFIRTHLHRVNRIRLILASSHALYSINPEPSFEENVVAVELDHPLKLNLGLEIVGSCDGLVCILSKPDGIFVFNPSTGEFREITGVPFPRASPLLFGFGYVAKADDYKFVAILVSSSGLVLHEFSLKTGAWKTVNVSQDFAFEMYRPSKLKGAFISGALHWSVHRNEEGMIVAFDLEQEKLKEVPLPKLIVERFSSCYLGALTGCLCILEDFVGSKGFSFWIMKEYGVRESWTRIFVSPPFDFVKPLCYWKNSKILLAKNGRKLLLCHPKYGDCKDFLVDNMPKGFESEAYPESLVSPNWGNRS